LISFFIFCSSYCSFDPQRVQNFSPSFGILPQEGHADRIFEAAGFFDTVSSGLIFFDSVFFDLIFSGSIFLFYQFNFCFLLPFLLCSHA
jgi:hypothetical protein